MAVQRGIKLWSSAVSIIRPSLKQLILDTYLSRRCTRGGRTWRGGGGGGGEGEGVAMEGERYKGALHNGGQKQGWNSSAGWDEMASGQVDLRRRRCYIHSSLQNTLFFPRDAWRQIVTLTREAQHQDYREVILCGNSVSDSPIGSDYFTDCLPAYGLCGVLRPCTKMRNFSSWKWGIWLCHAESRNWGPKCGMIPCNPECDGASGIGVPNAEWFRAIRNVMVHVPLPTWSFTGAPLRFVPPYSPHFNLPVCC